MALPIQAQLILTSAVLVLVVLLIRGSIDPANLSFANRADPNTTAPDDLSLAGLADPRSVAVVLGSAAMKSGLSSSVALTVVIPKNRIISIQGRCILN